MKPEAAAALLVIVGAVFLVPVLFIASVILATLAGSLVGWVVGWFFTETILGIFAALGIKGFAMWQIGAFLGFVSGFFNRGIQPKKKTANV